MPRHMISMIRAELRAVLGRTSGKVALIFGLLIPLVVAVLLAWFQQKTVDARFNGMPISQLADLTIRGLAGYALMVRNMVVLPLLLVLATAASVAGERRDNTLREVAVRPVSRWSIVLAKAISLLALSAGTLVLTLVPSLGLGAALFESSGGIDRVLLGYLTCLGTDLGLICLAMLAGSFVRSVGGVVVLLVLLMLGDLAARMLLTVAGNLGAEGALAIVEYFPGAALDAWEGWKDGFVGKQMAGLGLLIVGSFSATALRFTRMDIP